MTKTIEGFVDISQVSLDLTGVGAAVGTFGNTNGNKRTKKAGSSFHEHGGEAHSNLGETIAVTFFDACYETMSSKFTQVITKLSEPVIVLADHDKLDAAVQKIDRLAEDQNLKIEQDYDEYITGLNKKLEQLQGIKDTLEDSVSKIKEIDAVITNLETNSRGLEAQLKAAEEAEYDKGQLAAYQMRKKDLEKAIKEMKKGVADLKKEEVVSEFWKKAWSPTGIPSMLIDESIPFMNEKVSEYLDKLTNGRYLVSFDTLAATKAGEFRDKISVNVLDTHTRANSRIQLSGGQTRIVDIATILTLGDLQSNIQDVNINILLFDEIFDSLDEENIGFVSNILSQLKVGKSIYLISHTQVDQLEADEVLELK